jgi:spoIIIJ-associated protein
MAEMEQAVESVGADVEAAIAAGLARLGVDRDAVEIKVLEESSRGLFGLGGREARVRLTLKSHPASAVPTKPDFGETSFSRSAAEPLSRAVALPAAELAEPVVAEPALSLPREKDEAETSRGVLLELLALLGMKKAQVDVRRADPATDEEEPPLVLDVHGPGVDALIGRRGNTMAALQHIARLIVGREMAGRVHLVVDVDGFKARREKLLYRLAHRMAEQAMSTDRTVVLEPMPPHERRIVHLALRDHPHVTTESIGEGDRRKVTIIPH